MYLGKNWGFIEEVTPAEAEREAKQIVVLKAKELTAIFVVFVPVKEQHIGR